MIIVWVVLAIAVLIFAVILAAWLFSFIFHFLLTLFLLILVGGAGFAVWQLIRLGRRVQRVLDHIEGRLGRPGPSELDDGRERP